MDKKYAIEFANENPACYLATADGSQPRVRAFMLWFADETGFYFDTADYKDVCKQLKKNPNAEVCFYSPSEHRMMRVSGSVEFVEDVDLRRKLFEGKEDNPKTVIFRMGSGRVLFWWRDEAGKSQKEETPF